MSENQEEPAILQLEVAGTVITLSEREAALIVYCPATWQGQTIYASSRREYNMQASVTARYVGERVVYSAVFPRLLITYSYDWKYLENKSIPCDVRAYLSGWTASANVQLYAGNVTEVDWSTKPER